MVVVLGGVWTGAAGTASAQGVEVVGSRALGMGGAFVAVADDATAVYWNPAGLPRGGVLHLGVDWQTSETGVDDPSPRDGLDGRSAAFVGLTLPSIGLSYTRLRATRLLVPEPGSTPASMEAPGLGAATSLVTHNLGATLVQSIGRYLDVASTVRYVRARASIGPRGVPSLGEEDTLDRAADLPSRGSSTVDVDLGALLVLGRLRAGVLVRNLREPEFETTEPGVSIALDRQVRAGVALQSGPTTLAVDVDATESASAIGPQRHVAIGGEHWMAGRRLGARAGLRLNTAGDDRQPVGSAGLSVRVSGALFVDGQFTRGGDDRDRAWGFSLRYAY